MGSKRAAMFRFAAQVALVLLVVSGTSDSQLTFDDNVIDDLGVDALGSPDADGMLVHEDSEHMSKADVKQASDVYDTLFPTEAKGKAESAKLKAKSASVALPIKEKAEKAYEKFKKGHAPKMTDDVKK